MERERNADSDTGGSLVSCAYQLEENVESVGPGLITED